MTRTRIAAGFSIGLALAASAAASAVAGRVALDYGFRFASALDVDPKDKSKAQHAVVMEYAALGLLDEAVRRAGSIAGYRREVARADLAAQLARVGRKAEAAALVAQVEADRRTIQGWEGPRVAAHLAQAYAALGSVEPSDAIARDLAENDPRQYAGRSVATQAVALGVRGEYARAAEMLDDLEGDPDIEATWWRTMGYVDLSRAVALGEAERRSALGAARSAADGLPVWRRSQALVAIATRHREIGSREGEIEALAAAQAVVEALEPTDESRPVALAEVARAWVAAGQAERARGMLPGAEDGVTRAPDIDRPALYAAVASSWYAAGDAGASKRLYGQAFDAAASLENARPRALAVVEICRSLGRARVPLDPVTQERLDTLLGALGAPW